MPLPESPRCVITGAASGFGRALALSLAGRGAHLTLSDVDLESLDETARAAMAEGAASVQSSRCDVSRIEDVVAFADRCDGRVDLLVNNAGVSSGGLVGELSIDDWRWTLETDLYGVIYGCHVFLPRLRAQGSGHILNVASAAGLIAPPRTAPYNVAKAGVVALSETIASELVGTPIGVTVLCPTFFRTNIVKNGRFVHEAYRDAGQRLVDGGKAPETVVKAALSAVDEGRLYCVPMADGRWLWRVKRLVPSHLPRLLGMLARSRLRGHQRP